MNVVGRVGNFISQGVYYVATPFHPFGGAVDVIVVEQEDGTYRSTPWYVKFGKFQGVLKGAEKIVRIMVNGVEANFHMHLDNSGEAFFLKEVNIDSNKSSNWEESSPSQDESQILNSASQDSIDHQDEKIVVSGSIQTENLIGDEGDCDENEQREFRETSGSNAETTSPRHELESDNDQSPQGNSVAVSLSSYGAYRYETLDRKQIDRVEELVKSQSSDQEVVLISRDGHVMLAPVPTSDNTENMQLDTPRFHLVPGEASVERQDSGDLDVRFGREEIFQSCLALFDLHSHIEGEDLEGPSSEFLGSGGKDGSQDPQANDDRGCSPAIPPSSLGDFDNVTSKETVPGDDSGPEGKIGSPGPTTNVQDSLGSDDRESLLATSSNSPRGCGSVALEKPFVEDDSQQEEKMGSPALSIEVQASDSEIMINETTSSVNENFNHSDLQLETSNFKSPADGEECSKLEIMESQTETSGGGIKPCISMGLEISLCGNLLRVGMGVDAAAQVFDAHRVSEEEFKASGTSIIRNENLIVRWKESYLPWDKAAPIILGTAAFGSYFPSEPKDAIPVEQETTKTSEVAPSTPARGWRLWPIPFRRVKTLPERKNSLNEEVLVDTASPMGSLRVSQTSGGVDNESPRKQLRRTNVPTTEQIDSLNLKDGQNEITFSFSTRVLGTQQVNAHIYLWKWNARIVISDVDGTITKSDVLGQVMPLVGRDWTQFGVARLFSAIKENGYQLLFLSARAISQAYLTRNFLLNLKQDGKALPNGPVVISPDGLFPSLYREVIRRAPHEFKIACLEDIRALFPSDYNPFYAGFGNRDTDELSYRKIGIPKGKIFIINPKGEVAINHCIDVRSYTSLHTLVHDMFPPTSLAEQEDFNSWNYWKIPLPDIA